MTPSRSCAQQWSWHRQVWRVKVGITVTQHSYRYARMERVVFQPLVAVDWRGP